MTNQEHLDLLQQGVERWNQWRQEHPETQPDLRRAYLEHANLSYANLRGADPGFAKINGATLQGADFTQVRLSQTVFTDVDLRGVRGLKTVEHAGPSSIGIDTIYNSRGQIAKVFLRNTPLKP